MEPLKQGIGFLLRCREGEHIGDRDDEVGDDESAPEAHDHADDAPHEAFLEEVTIAHGGQGYNDVPHAVAQLREVLLRHH